ncbi:MAG: hypothetical protein AAFY34_08430 [Pseudomonadota bacterium]
MAEENETQDEGTPPDEAAKPPRLNRISILGLAALGVAGVSSVTLMLPSDQDLIDAQPARLPASEHQMERPPIPATSRGDVDFIVRFDDVPEIEECLATFRQDPSHARSVFRNWASKYPALSGFRLKKTNYSGELVLTWSGSGDLPSRTQIMDIKEQLQAMSAVRYADPDYSTQIEDDPR